MPASRIDPPVQPQRALKIVVCKLLSSVLKNRYLPQLGGQQGWIFDGRDPPLHLCDICCRWHVSSCIESQWDESETHPCIVAFRGRWPVINSWQLKHPTSMLHLSSHSTNRRWSMVFHNHMFRFLSQVPLLVTLLSWKPFHATQFHKKSFLSVIFLLQRFPTLATSHSFDPCLTDDHSHA